MTRWKIPQVWLVLWFLYLYFWSISSSTYLLTLNVNAIINAHPKLKPCRNVFCVLNIAILMTLHYTLTLNNIFDWKQANRLFSCFALIVLSLIIMKYGIRRLSVDYYFVYTRKLSEIFTNMLKLSVLFNLVFAMASLIFIVNFEENFKETIIFLLMLIPAFSYALYRFIKFLFKVIYF